MGVLVVVYFIVILFLLRIVNFFLINIFSEIWLSSFCFFVVKRIFGFMDFGENSEKLVEVKLNNLKLLDGFKLVKS